MLWSTVFDFFVINVFGGVTSDNVIYSASLGRGFLNGNRFPLSTAGIIVQQFTDSTGDVYSYSLGNYLSLIATIITMVALVLLCCALIKKIYNICAHVIG